MDTINNRVALLVPAIFALAFLLGALFAPVTKATAPYPLPAQEQAGGTQHPAATVPGPSQG